MIINSVNLHNIRSYEDETIELSEGITLLSGDIGSGKSTILLAIEFALFGIMRGGLSGGALLRHGQTKGHVELSFTIERNKIVVRRELKKTKDSIGQGSGYIITNGEKFEGTPVELKAKILEIIGYPDELVSKSKLSLFRFTVYTPQEQMKSILYEGNETRLDTLRRIFNIDKYKRIKENSVLLMREMRSEQKILETKLESSIELEKKQKEKEEKLKLSESELKKLTEKISSLEKKSSDAKKVLLELEEKSEIFSKKKNQLHLLEVSLENNKESANNHRESIKKLDEEITSLKKEIKPIEGKYELKKLEKEYNLEQEKLVKLREDQAKLDTKKEEAEKAKNDISKLDICPLCQQKVDRDHVHKVKSKQDERLDKIKVAYQQRKDLKEKIQVKLKFLDSKLQEARNLEKELLAMKEKEKSLSEKESRKQLWGKYLDDNLNKIKDSEQKIKKLKEIVDKNKNLNKQLESAKQDYEQEQKALNENKLIEARLQQDVKSSRESSKEINEKLSELQKEKEKLNKLKESLNWMNSYFVKIIEVMEKKVMLKIYGEFNEYFVEWFNILMEDESIQIRLDDTFSPVVVQDGYETTVENLSGGEKTSVALSYRLSLNKVINDFVGNIKTKEIIILDEPTDGFSSEQLDRVRAVLKQLNIKQILIVSHEAKMESYVDNVIKITKNDHLSKKNI